MSDEQRNTFPKSHRLSGKLAFERVYKEGHRDKRGPLVCVSLPNNLSHARLGLSVSRHVGTAPRRNRIKRLLRESFRLLQHDVPAGYDLVMIVRPHEPMALAKYQELMRHFMARAHTI